MLLFVGNFDNELAGEEANVIGHFAVKEKKGPQVFRFGGTQNLFNVSPATHCVLCTVRRADGHTCAVRPTLGDSQIG